MGFALDDEIESVVGEVVDGALGAEGVVEGGEPLIEFPVGVDDCGAGSVAFR